MFQFKDFRKQSRPYYDCYNYIYGKDKCQKIDILSISKSNKKKFDKLQMIFLSAFHFFSFFSVFF